MLFTVLFVDALLHMQKANPANVLKGNSNALANATLHLIG